MGGVCGGRTVAVSTSSILNAVVHYFMYSLCLCDRVHTRARVAPTVRSDARKTVASCHGAKVMHAKARVLC